MSSAEQVRSETPGKNSKNEAQQGAALAGEGRGIGQAGAEAPEESLDVGSLAPEACQKFDINVLGRARPSPSQDRQPPDEAESPAALGEEILELLRCLEQAVHLRNFLRIRCISTKPLVLRGVAWRRPNSRRASTKRLIFSFSVIVSILPATARRGQNGRGWPRADERSRAGTDAGREDVGGASRPAI